MISPITGQEHRVNPWPVSPRRPFRSPPTPGLFDDASDRAHGNGTTLTGGNDEIGEPPFLYVRHLSAANDRDTSAIQAGTLE
jgi:hypothetical protein